MSIKQRIKKIEDVIKDKVSEIAFAVDMTGLGDGNEGDSLKIYVCKKTSHESTLWTPINNNPADKGEPSFVALFFQVINEDENEVKNLLSSLFSSENLIYHYLKQQLRSNISSLDKITLTSKELFKYNSLPMMDEWRGRVVLTSEDLLGTVALLSAFTHTYVKVKDPDEGVLSRSGYPIPIETTINLSFYDEKSHIHINIESNEPHYHNYLEKIW